MGKAVFNGTYVDRSRAVFKTSNRGFSYADGLFETFRVFKSMPLYLDEHWARMERGLDLLKIEIPSSFTKSRLRFHFQKLASENQISDGSRARLTLFRNPGGRYKPQDNGMSYLLEMESLDSPFFELNRQGKSLEVYREVPKYRTPFSSFKMLSCYPSILASIEGQEKGWDEMLLVNEGGEIIESTHGNLFWVKNGHVFTVPLNAGCVAGVLRMKIINFCIASKIACYEQIPTVEILLDADEIFVSNSVQGVQWINRFQSKRYFNKYAKFFIDQLNESMLNSWRDLEGSE